VLGYHVVKFHAFPFWLLYGQTKHLASTFMQGEFKSQGPLFCKNCTYAICLATFLQYALFWVYRISYKVKLTLEQNINTHRVSRGIVLLFNLGARRRWVVNATSRPLYPGKGTRYPLHRRLGGPQSRSGLVRKIFPPPGFDPRAVQPIASRYTDYAIPAHFL
jgi:hypothetical protein